MAEIQEVRAVLVSNISPNANEKTVSDFFSFCGKITKLYLNKEEGKDTSSAIIQFETESAAKTALLLTNALIVDRPITVSAYIASFTPLNTESTTSPNVGTPVDQSKISQKDFNGIPDDQRSKTSVIASLLAAGYILTENALDKAKEVDEKTNFSNRAKVTVDQLKVKAHEIDLQYGISEKAVAVTKSITESAKKIDSEFGITEKAVAVATVVKNSAQQGYQKAQDNATVKKGVESVKSTVEKVSNSVTQTYNDVRTQTNKEIEVKEKQRENVDPVTEATYGVSNPPNTVTMESSAPNNTVPVSNITEKQ